MKFNRYLEQIFQTGFALTDAVLLLKKLQDINFLDASDLATYTTKLFSMGTSANSNSTVASVPVQTPTETPSNDNKKPFNWEGTPVKV